MFYTLTSNLHQVMMIPLTISPFFITISVLLVVVFTILTNLLLKRTIKRIDMVESLKSVE